MSEFFAMVIASIVAFVSSILGDAPLPPVIPPAAVPQVEVSVKVQEPVVKQAKTSQPTQQPSKKSGSVQPAPETKPAESTSTPTPEESSVAPALFKDLGGTTRVLANGNAVLARFSITAGNVAASIDGINLVLTRYGGVEASKVRVFAFTDEFRTPVTTHTDGKLFGSTETFRSESGLVHTSDVALGFATPLLVPAMETRYLMVLAEIARVEDHPDYMIASVHGIDGVEGTTKWWMTFNGEPANTTGGYNLSQSASAAVVFEFIKSIFAKFAMLFTR